MIELLGENQIAVPDVAGYRHPLAAVYRVGVLEAVHRLLAQDRLRPAFLFDYVPTRFVTADELVIADSELQTLRNLNTRADYEAALRELTLAEQDKLE
jgi:molybdopterin-guanine dinucleotide biosynthesis protein A